MIRMATIFATLIIVDAGPAVSLYGSPTVSPVTEAAMSEGTFAAEVTFLDDFFALSQAPPPEVMASRQTSR